MFLRRLLFSDCRLYNEWQSSKSERFSEPWCQMRVVERISRRNEMNTFLFTSRDSIHFTLEFTVCLTFVFIFIYSQWRPQFNARSSETIDWQKWYSGDIPVFPVSLSIHALSTLFVSQNLKGGTLMRLTFSKLTRKRKKKVFKIEL